MTLRAAVYEHLLTFKVTHFVASAVAGTPAIPATSNPSKSAGENGGADDPLRLQLQRLVSPQLPKKGILGNRKGGLELPG